MTGGERREEQAAAGEQQQSDRGGTAMPGDLRPVNSPACAPLRLGESAETKPHHPQSAPGSKIIAMT
jgi:hypothetical protein